MNDTQCLGEYLKRQAPFSICGGWSLPLYFETLQNGIFITQSVEIFKLIIYLCLLLYVYYGR